MAFASATVAIAATEIYVAKDAQGKVSILDKKPTDQPLSSRVLSLARQKLRRL